jgi:uncharacterized protein YejL (UPF0352 family)
MTNRIGGDFGQDAVEAFRAAYAQILNAPEDDGVANASGLPTDIVANTSPWHDHMPLWKYPSGKGPEEDLKTPFNPNDYVSEEEDESGFSDEEIEALMNELLDDRGEENAPLTDEEIDQIVSELLDDDEEE